MEKTTGRSFFNLVNASWEATKDERFRFYLFIFLFVLSCSTDLLIPWAIAYILGIYETHGLTPQAFTMSLYGIGMYLGLRFLNTLFHHRARYVQNTVAYTARMHTLERIFSTFMLYPLHWHVRHHSGENLSKLYRSAGAVESSIGTYVWQVVEGAVKVLFAGVALFALDFWVAVTVLVTTFATIIAMILFNKRLTNRIKRNFGFANKINRICVDYLMNIITVKTLSLEPAATRYLSSQKMEGLSLSQKISKYSELKWGSTSMGHGLVTGFSLLIYFYTHQGTGGPFKIGEVYVLLSYLDRIFAAVGSFTGYYGGLIEASTAYEDATELFESSSKLSAEKTAFSIDESWKVLSLRNLNFSYGGGERAGLRDLNLDIRRSDKIALVGPSGGGKSTLLKILGGLLPPETSEVFTDIQKDIPVQEVSQLALLIPQEPEIFSESLYYNLTMGEAIPDSEIRHFISLCRLDSVVEKLPNGWNTDLAEKGLNLSVGEKQRVAMTRGLLRARKKDILLLDEPTSSLDPRTEKEVFLGLLSHFSDRTVITACHRLNLVPLFDKIIFVRAGRVEEVGTFQELVNIPDGAFAKAWVDYQKKVARE